jgi:hypothetical protein
MVGHRRAPIGCLEVLDRYGEDLSVYQGEVLVLRLTVIQTGVAF